jgi:hypothetical protein
MESAITFREPEPPVQSESSARRPRTKVQHNRSKWYHVTEPTARAHGVAFPTLQEIADLTSDAYEAIVAQVAESLAAVAGGIANPQIPSYEIQLANFRMWQKQFGPDSYFQWPEAAMRTLAAKLDELGPGARLTPNFAMSVGCVLPNGRCAQINRQGEIVKS